MKRKQILILALVISGILIGLQPISAKGDSIISCPTKATSEWENPLSGAIYQGACNDFIPWSYNAIAKKLNRNLMEGGTPITILGGADTGLDTIDVAPGDLYNWISGYSSPSGWSPYHPGGAGIGCISTACGATTPPPLNYTVTVGPGGYDSPSTVVGYGSLGDYSNGE